MYMVLFVYKNKRAVFPPFCVYIYFASKMLSILLQASTTLS